MQRCMAALAALYCGRGARAPRSSSVQIVVCCGQCDARPAIMYMCGSPYTDELHATRDQVLAARRSIRAGHPGSGDLEAAVPDGSSVKDFFAGRDILVTGGSGFLGRLLVELLLRGCPDVGTIYLVFRSKKGVMAQDRMRAAYADPLFDRLRAEQPHALDKLQALPGDIAEPHLGLSEEDRAMLRDRVSVVFHVAATVRFNEPVKKAVLTNLRSTRDAVNLAKEMPHLKVFQHVSTAYTFTNVDKLEERMYTTQFDWRLVIKAAETLPDPLSMDFLGRKLTGFQPNTYTFSKALAEQVVNEAAKEIPAVIVRPSIVIGTLQDPIPGWIDNLYGFSVFWVLFFKGILRVYFSPSNFVSNIVPGDIVVKAMVLAAWVKGTGGKINPKSDSKDVEVVNSVVFDALGIRFKDMADISGLIVNLTPYPGAVRYPIFTLTTSKIKYAIMFIWHHFFFGLVIDLLAIIAKQKPRLTDIYRKLVFNNTATYYFQRQFYFEGKNQWRLQSAVHPTDEKDFCNVDILNKKDTEKIYVDWVVSSCRGILLYALKEEDNIQKNIAAFTRLWWIQTTFEIVFAALVVFLLVTYYSW